ncbi:hypothetical protein AB1Y20_019982 [Prymnesium parvum]|uniref:RING-type domain-containing protein n=1 Tax=Prymnesium parvum TaxID=97485 RepID=A0AB34JTW9_PRYPA
MGCGASVDKRIWGSRKRGKLPAPAPAPQAQPFPRDNIVTPPTGQRGESHGLITHPVNARQNLRIETAHAPAASRREAGLAVTPVGKQADEFRFFCPVCMMFYRSILELECCKQSVCSFCLSEYVQKRTASALASDHRKPVLPAGVACPQCATVNKTRSQLLKTLEAGDVPERAYVTSPKTSQQLEELTSRREQPASPLKRLLRRVLWRARQPAARAHPAAEVSVEWRRGGGEQHFIMHLLAGRP